MARLMCKSFLKPQATLLLLMLAACSAAAAAAAGSDGQTSGMYTTSVWCPHWLCIWCHNQCMVSTDLIDCSSHWRALQVPLPATAPVANVSGAA